MSLDDTLHEVSQQPLPDQEFEANVFRAKVYRALKEVEKQSEFAEFECYRLRLTRNMQGKDISAALGISEASVSRYLKRVRDSLRQAIGMAVAGYSWTDDERAQLKTSGLNSADDDAFDNALSDVYLTDEKSRRDYGKMQKTARSVR